MQKPINILLLYTGKHWSGIGSHGAVLAGGLMKKGINVVLGCPRGGKLYAQAEALGITVRHIGMKNLMDFASWYRILRVARQDNIDIICANLGKEYWPLAVICRVLGLKSVIVRHQMNKLKTLTNRLIKGDIDKIIAVSGAVKRTLINSGIDGDKIEVIYNSVDLGRFDPLLKSGRVSRNEIRAELGLAKDDIVIASVGRITEDKGGLDLLYAFKEAVGVYPRMRLVFAGDGPFRSSLEGHAADLSISGRVHFTGYRDDVERMYAAADIVVVPTRGLESFGMVVIEAMAMERPVIASDVGGIPEIITHGVNGLLFNATDRAGLRACICELIENLSLASRLAAEGRKTVVERFSDGAFSERFADVLYNLML
ncbi:glycosyltransferase family 4 protein [Candidatus Magnetominusculus xianensis]|uniref:Glycosyl transferase family 1 n=1 Tax=Candidatus Magnetominusculus xianensis TaxID=1748249 RepID=A0ABR5SJE3_9BACT|nr:glycosyltransferase family 4 protein [Candidatus Magnetominusculus xianensis]KWT91094.1 glycosyl transferase family 1 [Candidatus Magnetominusculus xianensis]MBF0403261.1 glycosyltransferase family 4 protein [Nitrospirota bacterium]